MLICDILIYDITGFPGIISTIIKTLAAKSDAALKMRSRIVLHLG